MNRSQDRKHGHCREVAFVGSWPLLEVQRPWTISFQYLCSKPFPYHVGVWQCTIFCLVNLAWCYRQSLHRVMPLIKENIHKSANAFLVSSRNKVYTHKS